MPRVGFEPTIPVFKRTKAVHALERAITVLGTHHINDVKKKQNNLENCDISIVSCTAYEFHTTPDLIKTKLNSVDLVRKQNIPSERPPLGGEVSANFC
jgi:hypothetical protein